jgi:(p)ppGpp synthase/HD superfamily hydrolase
VTAYAQTNLELYRQLGEAGYAPADVSRVQQGYELALPLFTGAFRSSGKSFLCHLVGTASILAAIRARVDVIAAGLLHAVYDEGEFGNGWRGASADRRARFVSAVGAPVEDLVHRSDALRWAPTSIAAIQAGLSSMSALERDVVLIRLANELEDHLDLGVLYGANSESRRRFMEEHRRACFAMAEELGAQALADELAAVFDEVAKADVGPELRRGERGSFRVAPSTHRTRTRVALSHWLARRMRS